MKTLLLAGVMALGTCQAAAQTPGAPSAAQGGGTAEDDARAATRTGHEVSVSVGHYTYVEPGALRISIHGTKIGGEYTGTLPLNERRHWFARADVRGSTGSTTYDGWCFPFIIEPNSASPNGYELGPGSYSPCSETGDADWSMDARAQVGRDFFGDKWGVSPETGLGVRYLSNGTSGVAGFRTDTYLYLPLSLTARTMASHRVLSFTVEYDALLHGWQATHQSKLGGGEGPATATTPAFTIDSFTDLSFPQDRGWALRARAKYQVTHRWSIEPSYIHWNVGASPVRYSTVAVTVNGVTAEQQLGAYEPVNVTSEVFVSLGFHF